MNSKNARNRARIDRRREEMHAEILRIKYCTPKVVAELKSHTHPRLPDSDLTLWNYVDWLLNNGYTVKALPFIKTLASEYKEAYDKRRVKMLERDMDNYGVPATYR